MNLEKRTSKGRKPVSPTPDRLERLPEYARIYITELETRIRELEGNSRRGGNKPTHEPGENTHFTATPAGERSISSEVNCRLEDDLIVIKNQGTHLEVISQGRKLVINPQAANYIKISTSS